MIGQIVNHYVIRGLIGQGGMGAVYLAEHSFIGRRAAIKVLRRAFADDGDVIARFMNEARAANAIRHRNIIDILDVGRLSDGLPYLLMEYLEGETLGQRLARVGRLSVAEAVAIIGPAAAGLSAAHQAGVVHRDLKPDNIFLARAPRSDTERVILLDFGVAKLRGDPSNVATGAALLGTPAYMSPEQCRGIGEVDARTDVYALGTILFQMLCGRVPFVSSGFGDVLVKHLLEAPAAAALAGARDPWAGRGDDPPQPQQGPRPRFATMEEAWAALCSATPTPGPVPIEPSAATSAPSSGRGSRPPSKRAPRQDPPPLTDSALELRRSGFLSKVVVATAVALSVGAWAWTRWHPASDSHAAQSPPMAIPVPAVAPEPEPPAAAEPTDPPDPRSPSQSPKSRPRRCPNRPPGHPPPPARPPRRPRPKPPPPRPWPLPSSAVPGTGAPAPAGLRCADPAPRPLGKKSNHEPRRWVAARRTPPRLEARSQTSRPKPGWTSGQHVPPRTPPSPPGARADIRGRHPPKTPVRHPPPGDLFPPPPPRPGRRRRPTALPPAPPRPPPAHRAPRPRAPTPSPPTTELLAPHRQPCPGQPRSRQHRQPGPGQPRFRQHRQPSPGQPRSRAAPRTPPLPISGSSARGGLRSA